MSDKLNFTRKLVCGQRKICLPTGCQQCIFTVPNLIKRTIKATATCQPNPCNDDKLWPVFSVTDNKYKCLKKIENIEYCPGDVVEDGDAVSCTLIDNRNTISDGILTRKCRGGERYIAVFKKCVANITLNFEDDFTLKLEDDAFSDYE